MKTLLLALGVPIALVAMAIKTVLRREYAWWGPTLARWMVRVAARFQGHNRERYAQEWLAELEQIRADYGVAGLMWASSILATAPVTRWSARPRSSAQWPALKGWQRLWWLSPPTGLAAGIFMVRLNEPWIDTATAIVSLPAGFVISYLSYRTSRTTGSRNVSG